MIKSSHILTVVSFLFVGCGVPESVPGDQGTVLSPDELRTQVAAAEDGDLRAANSLAVHFANTGNLQESARWLEFAGRRGDCNALGVLFDENKLDEEPSQERSRELQSLAAEFDCAELE